MFHDVRFTYKLLRAHWTEYKYHIFRTGANLRCYGYKCDRCIKVNVRIIPKLQNWIGNILFFENMHISVILPKIKKSYGQSLRPSGTTLVRQQTGTSEPVPHTICKTTRHWDSNTEHVKGRRNWAVYFWIQCIVIVWKKDGADYKSCSPKGNFVQYILS